MTKSSDIWNEPLNTFVHTGKAYRGAILYAGAEMKFSITRQVSGKYVWRGSISIISPLSGKIMKTQGKPVSAEVYSQAIMEDGIKSDLLRSAEKLYRNNVRQIFREAQQSATKSTITPIVAAQLYAENFVSAVHKNLQPSSAKKYVGTLQTHYARLPNKAMASFSAKDTAKYLCENSIGTSTQKLLAEFWRYLLDKGTVIGTNPFPPPPKKRISAQAKQRHLGTVSELTLEQQDRLYNLIMHKDALHGGDCGLALMLWGGYTVGDQLKWGQVAFSDENSDFVKILFHRDDLAGGTHNFSCPLFVQAARIVRRARDHLLLSYTPEQIRQMPVIGMQSNPQKPMTANQLHQYIGKALREIGIGEITFAAPKGDIAVAKRILLNTYEKNIYLRCGLAADEGSMQFLQHLSVAANVTDDHYTSFSDDDAAMRLFTALRTMAPNEKTDLEEYSCSAAEDGQLYHCYSPQYTRDIVGINGTVILPPGAEFSLICPHGVSGDISVRATDDAGKPKRKSGKKKEKKGENQKP